MRTGNQPEQTTAQPKPTAPTPEHIQKRAYEIYEARSREAGHEWDDWLLAENELKSQLGLRRDSAE